MDEDDLARRRTIDAVQDPTPEVAALLGVGLQYGGRPFNVPTRLAHHPRLLQAFLVFAELLLQSSTIPDRDRELLTLRSARRSGSDYYFGHHRRIAPGLGVSPEEIVAVVDDGHEWPEEDRLLLAVADELVIDGVVSDATWDALLDRYATDQVLEIVMLPGFYRMMAGLVASVGIEREDGVAGWPECIDAPEPSPG